MRWALAWSAMFVVACGARSDLTGMGDIPTVDASIHDAPIDVHITDGAVIPDAAHDAPPKESGVDAGLCCDKSGDNFCVECPSDAICTQTGLCIHKVTDCATQCAGCCLSSTECIAGQATHGCGHDGQACQSCIIGSSIGSCVALSTGGGVCSTGETCSPENCNACCDGNVCALGNTNARCGADGEPCRTCAQGETCYAYSPRSGSCQTAPFCGFPGCMTCCQGNACMPGNSDTACGSSSDICHDCTASGKICVNNQCVAGCSAQTCSGGCCVGGVCAVGTQDFACGSGGVSCADCTATHLHCTSHACNN